ncbi:MAG: MurT ligase domain-containing protein [Tissierellia bacterium]|nr:MurT ligase domain-containing protein [Tissierellia bacterium]
MKLKSKIAIYSAKFTRKILRIFNRQATSLPGKVALTIDKDILNELTDNTEFIFVTGTNGKTMTTAFITNILRYKYEHTITNDSGANMIQGIVTSLLNNRKNEDTVAIMEVDEANLRKITDFIKPDYIVLTNLFEDQLDRFKSVENTFNIVLEGIKKAKDAKIIANGDLPIFAKNKLKKYNPVYFGVDYKKGKENTYKCPECGKELSYEYYNYENLGKYKCDNCYLRRPKRDYVVNKIIDIKPKNSTICLDDMEVSLNVGGIYNIYNATSAWALAKVMGVDDKSIKTALEGQQNLPGRQEEIFLYAKDVVMNLVKNQAGFNQVMELLKIEDEFTLYFIINNNFADGRDISWLSQIDADVLKQLNYHGKIIISGMKAFEFDEILKNMGIFDTLVIQDINNIKDNIKNQPTKKINILANYTALNDFRKSIGL